MKPYTYLIGWASIGIWYYGVRYANKCSPGELWKEYFTSSKYVAEMRKLHGEPDIVEVRRIFDSPDAARQWEFKVLRRLGVASQDKWLNKTAGGPRFNTGREIPDEERQMRSRIRMGRRQTPAAIAKTAAANTGRPKSDQCKANISLALKGRTFTPEWRERIGAGNRGKVRSQDFRDQLTIRNTGRKHTPEAIEKMRQAARSRKAAA